MLNDELQHGSEVIIVSPTSSEFLLHSAFFCILADLSCLCLFWHPCGPTSTALEFFLAIAEVLMS